MKKTIKSAVFEVFHGPTGKRRLIPVAFSLHNSTKNMAFAVEGLPQGRKKTKLNLCSQNKTDILSVTFPADDLFPTSGEERARPGSIILPIG